MQNHDERNCGVNTNLMQKSHAKINLMNLYHQVIGAQLVGSRKSADGSLFPGQLILVTQISWSDPEIRRPQPARFEAPILHLGAGNEPLMVSNQRHWGTYMEHTNIIQHVQDIVLVNNCIPQTSITIYNVNQIGQFCDHCYIVYGDHILYITTSIYPTN